MLDEGTRLQIFVRDFTGCDFQETCAPQIIKACCGDQGGTLEDIGILWEGYDASQKASLHRELTNKDNWAWHATAEGIRIICTHFLCGLSDESVCKLQNIFGKIILDLANLQAPKSYHVGFFGTTGAGKSTSAIQVVEAIILGRFGAGSNRALATELEKMQGASHTAPKVQVLVDKPRSANYILVAITAKMTEAALLKVVRENLAMADVLSSLVVIIHYDEVDKLGAMTDAKRTEFMGVFQQLLMGELTDRRWFPTGTDPDDRHVPHVFIHVWSGNIPFSETVAHSVACQEIRAGLENTVKYPKIFDCTRMPELAHIVPLL